MFKKNVTATISVEMNGEVKQAKADVTGEPLPVILTAPVNVEKLSIVQTGKTVVVTLGNDTQLINVELKG